nr:hypothetical protein [Candidatus Njordarchaeum guaymaensis]
MSVIFWWRKRASVGLALVLIGLAGIAQSFVVLHAQTVLGVTSIYLLTLVPLGASITLGGVEMSLVEAIHARFAVRERKTSKWKKGERRGLSGMLGKLEVASVLSVLLVLVFSSVFYISIVTVCQGTGIPYYARFAFAEVVSALIVVTVSIIIGRITGSRGHSLFST